MNQVEWKPFQFEHLDLFAWQEADAKTYGIRSEVMDAIVSAAEKGECWTAVCDGRIIVIFGVIPHTKKTGYCFSIFSEYAAKHKIAAARTVRRMFNAILSDMELHRVVTYNRAEADLHHRWCEWLGFQFEAKLEKFDDEGNAYLQYALIR